MCCFAFTSGLQRFPSLSHFDFKFFTLLKTSTTMSMIVRRGHQSKPLVKAKAIRIKLGGFALSRSFGRLRLSVIARCCFFSTHLQISTLLSKTWIVCHLCIVCASKSLWFVDSKMLALSSAKFWVFGSMFGIRVRQSVSVRW